MSIFPLNMPLSLSSSFSVEIKRKLKDQTDEPSRTLITCICILQKIFSFFALNTCLRTTKKDAFSEWFVQLGGSLDIFFLVQETIIMHVCFTETLFLKQSQWRASLGIVVHANLQLHICILTKSYCQSLVIIFGLSSTQGCTTGDSIILV